MRWGNFPRKNVESGLSLTEYHLSVKRTIEYFPFLMMGEISYEYSNVYLRNIVTRSRSTMEKEWMRFLLLPLIGEVRGGTPASLPYKGRSLKNISSQLQNDPMKLMSSSSRQVAMPIVTQDRRVMDMPLLVHSAIRSHHSDHPFHHFSQIINGFMNSQVSHSRRHRFLFCHPVGIPFKITFEKRTHKIS